MVLQADKRPLAVAPVAFGKEKKRVITIKGLKGGLKYKRASFVSPNPVLSALPIL